MNSHAAAARCLYGEDSALVDEVLADIKEGRGHGEDEGAFEHCR